MLKVYRYTQPWAWKLFNKYTPGGINKVQLGSFCSSGRFPALRSSVLQWKAAKDAVNQCFWRTYVMAHPHCQHLVQGQVSVFRPLLLSPLWYFTICAKFCLKEIVPGFYELHSQFLFSFLLGVWRYSNLLRYFDISSLLPALCCFSSI